MDYTGDVKCNSCRQIVTPGSDLPLGSDVPASVWSTDETHHWKACLTIGCGNKIETAAHTYGDWTVTKESTTTEKGSKEKTCSVCGHKVTEELPLAENTS